ncbi:MAG: zinc ribbon domain-containing protein, partial [Thermoanaerobaculia bacterium]
MERLSCFWRGVLKEVEKLWELQQILMQLTDCEKQMSIKPESFAAIDREFQGANEEMTRLGESYETMARERRRVDGELSDQQELLKKYQGQLMQVKNQQQYAAAWKEIDAARKHVKDLEDSALKTMSEMEGVQKQLDEKRAGHDELQARYDKAHEEWQHSLGDLRAEAEQLKKKAA